MSSRLRVEPPSPFLPHGRSLPPTAGAHPGLTLSPFASCFTLDTAPAALSAKELKWAKARLIWTDALSSRQFRLSSSRRSYQTKSPTGDSTCCLRVQGYACFAHWLPLALFIQVQMTGQPARSRILCLPPPPPLDVAHPQSAVTLGWRKCLKIGRAHLCLFPGPRSPTPVLRGGSLEHVTADSRKKVGVCCSRRVRAVQLGFCGTRTQGMCCRFAFDL